MKSSSKNVLISPSPYTTLLYFLANDLPDIQDTAYFFVRTRRWTDSEIAGTRAILPQSYFLKEPGLTIRFRKHALLQKLYTALQLAGKRALPYAWLRFTKNLRWPFLKDAEILCYDNCSTIKALLGRKEHVYFEEGLFTYENADIYAGGASFARNFLCLLFGDNCYP